MQTNRMGRTPESHFRLAPALYSPPNPRISQAESHPPSGPTRRPGYQSRGHSPTNFRNAHPSTHAAHGSLGSQMIIRSVYRVIAAAPTVGDVAYRPIQIRDCAACGAVDSAEDPPPNDDFANAIPIAGTSGTIVGDNSNATREDGELSSWGGEASGTRGRPGVPVWRRSTPADHHTTPCQLSIRERGPTVRPFWPTMTIGWETDWLIAEVWCWARIIKRGSPCPWRSESATRLP